MQAGYPGSKPDEQRRLCNRAREMRRILSPGGCLALVTALAEQLHGAGLPVVTMTEEITSRHWLKILAEVTLGTRDAGRSARRLPR